MIRKFQQHRNKTAFHSSKSRRAAKNTTTKRIVRAPPRRFYPLLALCTYTSLALVHNERGTFDCYELLRPLRDVLQSYEVLFSSNG